MRKWRELFRHLTRMEDRLSDLHGWIAAMERRVLRIEDAVVPPPPKKGLVAFQLTNWENKKAAVAGSSVHLLSKRITDLERRMQAGEMTDIKDLEATVGDLERRLKTFSLVSREMEGGLVDLREQVAGLSERTAIQKGAILSLEKRFLDLRDHSNRWEITQEKRIANLGKKLDVSVSISRKRFADLEEKVHRLWRIVDRFVQKDTMVTERFDTQEKRIAGLEVLTSSSQDALNEHLHSLLPNKEVGEKP